MIRLATGRALLRFLEAGAARRDAEIATKQQWLVRVREQVCRAGTVR